MDRITIHPPFFLAESGEICWKCGENCTVYAFVASDVTDDDGGPAFEGPYFLRNIEELPDPLARALPGGTGCFAKVSSRTAGLAYYANLCRCGANFGDHYLFSEPGGAFFPLDLEGLSRIRLIPIESSEAIEVAAGYGTTPAGLPV